MLLLWLLFGGSDALFFGLGGEGGGCSCPSSCGAPPPTNFGCQLMCPQNSLNCQGYGNSYGSQVAYNQPSSYAQPPSYNQNYGRNYGYQSQSFFQNSAQNTQPTYQSNHLDYARPQPQFQQQANYVPPAPTRFVDNYAQAVARVAENFERHPPPPAAPPTYSQQTSFVQPYQPPQPAAPVAPVNPVPSNNYATATHTASHTAHQEQISLLPPAHSEGEAAQPAVVETKSQGSYYTASTEIALREAQVSTSKHPHPPTGNPAKYGKSASHSHDMNWDGASSSPEDIIKSIEDSYDERSDDLMEQKEVHPSSQYRPSVEIATNKVTILPSVTYGLDTTEAPKESILDIKPVPKEAQTKEVEYALGSQYSPTTIGDEPISTTTPAALVFKTLTRAEGYSSDNDNISSSGYNYKSTTSDPVTEYEEELNTKPETEVESNSISAENTDFGYGKARDEPSAPNEPKTAAKRSQDPSAFKCNNEKLRELMDEKMTSSAPVSKQLIYAAGTSAFPGLSLDVICSRHSFSYIVVTSPIYCEHRKDSLTCFAFFQP